jgi:phosphoadenosine phosphosulfate reductase
MANEENKTGSQEPDKSEFGEDRTQRCIALMDPEIREWLKLPLAKKVDKTREIIKEAVAKYERVGIGFSGGGDSEAMLHIAMQVKHDMPVLFVDTRYEFPETIPFIEKIRSDWSIESLTTVRAASDKAEEFKKKYGFGTPEFTLEFNKYHKIEPLLKGIKNLKLDAFLGGIRGVEHEERAKEKVFSPRDNHVRVHPILFWTRDDVRTYLDNNKLPHNPLYDKGYTSLGSTLDTTPNKEGMHERAGRGVARERIMKKLRDLGYN